jgi:hypothetical protein
MYHALTRKHGGVAARVHNYVHALARWCKQATHDPKLELAVPEFARLSPFARNAAPTRSQFSANSQSLDDTRSPAPDTDNSHHYSGHSQSPSDHETSRIQDGVIDIVSWSPLTPPISILTLQSEIHYTSMQLTHTISMDKPTPWQNKINTRGSTFRWKTVTPCAIETWGRLGESFLTPLQHLSQQTCALQNHRVSPPTNN